MRDRFPLSVTYVILLDLPSFITQGSYHRMNTRTFLGVQSMYQFVQGPRLAMMCSMFQLLNWRFQACVARSSPAICMLGSSVCRWGLCSLQCTPGDADGERFLRTSTVLGLFKPGRCTRRNVIDCYENQTILQCFTLNKTTELDRCSHKMVMVARHVTGDLL